jgi:hypothetical protein
MPDNIVPPGDLPPKLPTGTLGTASSGRRWLAIFLSLYLGLFLTDAAVSFADDSLILFFGLHPLSIIRLLLSSFTLLMSLGIYVLMALTPMIPKRLFLPLALFDLAVTLAMMPVIIYAFDRVQLAAWFFSGAEVAVGLLVLFAAGGRFQWPLVAEARLRAASFTWRNLLGVGLATVFGLLPFVLVCFFYSAALAVDHYTAGFMALHPGGFTVQVRKYVNADGKTIELFPMSHVADAGFYQQVSATFPTNSLILMEGVTDSQNLLTNKITYKRMAKSLGLAEQKEKFVPTKGEMIRADIDIDEFTPETISLLNLVMLFHVQGVNANNMSQFTQFAPPPHFEVKLLDDLVGRRNRHLLSEIEIRLPQSDNLMVPWGVAHMPGISRGIEKTGFHLIESHDYQVIQFFGQRE